MRSGPNVTDGRPYNFKINSYLCDGPESEGREAPIMGHLNMGGGLYGHHQAVTLLYKLG